LKDKKIAFPRFCKYIKCRKLLPKDAHHQKKYCQDTKCFYLQNQLEAKERRDKLKANKPKKFKICNFDECGKEFEIPTNSPLQAYCDDKCRDANRKKVQAKRWEQEQIKIVAKREEVVRMNKSKDKKSGLPKRLLVRGNISHGNVACAISVNA